MHIKTLYPFEFKLSTPVEDVDFKTIYCPICGTFAEIEPFTENRRESGFCSHCGSWNRQRLMAILLLRAIEQKTGIHLESLSSSEMPDCLQIYSAEWFGALHKALRHLKGYTWSRYSGSMYNSGEIVDGHPHQSLLETSFPENKFDIILTADVLEHIPEPYLAHREIYRILKPGGVHIFTVPSNMNNPLDDQRATIIDGEIIHLSEPEWHGKEVDSNLVYTVFGVEMLSYLWMLGYDVRLYEIDSKKMGVVGPRAIGFEAIKTHKPLSQKVPTGLRNPKPKYL